MKERIKALALEAGFDAAGIAPVGRMPHADVLQSWIAEGSHGEMDWMSRTAGDRSDPGVRFPWAKSILSVLLAYPGHVEEKDGPNDGGGLGKISAYAAGEDYHRIMERMLKGLCASIVEETGPDTQARWYVDTGPIMEREVAHQAGLGVIGKNTMLLREDLGSFFFIGEILLSLVLESDVPLDTDLCLECTACLDACPTGALVSPMKLDARTCISYLTIEHRGAIDPPLREVMGDWIFGCDICQTVCPYNQDVPEAGPNAPVPVEGRTRPMLIDFLIMNDNLFNETFRHSPIKRTKRSGLVRNACIAMGNAGDPAAFAMLGHLSKTDADDTVREHATWAIEKLDRLNPRP